MPHLLPTFIAIILGALLGLLAGTSTRALLRRTPRGTAIPPPWLVPATAMLTAVPAGLAGAGLLSWAWLPVPVALAWVAVPLAAVDIRHRRLPDVLTLTALPVFAVLVTLAAVLGPDGGMAIRAALGGALFFLTHLVVHLLSPGSLGAGDVKLSASLGAVAAAVSWPALIVVAAAAGTVTAVADLVRRLRVRAPPAPAGMPHGPGLLAATWLVTVLAGQGGVLG
ncbi:prepilin peptidase [Crossiella sp. NPDC003009]